MRSIYYELRNATWFRTGCGLSMGNAKLDGVDVLEFAKNYAVEKCGQLYRGDVCGLAHCPTTCTHNKEDAPLGRVPLCTQCGLHAW